MQKRTLMNVAVILLLGVLGEAMCLSAPLPPGERPQERAILKGHSSLLHGLAFSPDGQTLASAGGDGTIRLWDTANGKNLAILKHVFSKQLERMQPSVNATAFSPDGKILASCSDEDTIALWKSTSGVATTTLAQMGFWHSLVFNRDGKSLLAVGRPMLLWDLETKKAQLILGQFDGWNPVAAFDPQGKLFVAGIDKGAYDLRSSTFSLLEVATGKKSRTFKGHTAMVSALAFSSDTKTLASAGDDKTVRLWDVATGKNTATFGDFPAPPSCPAFSPDGKILACGCMYQGSDGRKPRRSFIRLYELATGRILATLKGDPGGCFLLTFSPDGRFLAAGTCDQHIALWALPRRYAPDE